MVRQTQIAVPAAPAVSPRLARHLKAVLGRDWKVAIPFVLPMVVIMVGLILWPIIDAIILSTTSLNFITGETVFVGLGNYVRLLSSSDYELAIRNTLQFTLWSLSLKIVTGMTIALILNSRLPYRNILSGIMLLPWIVPEIVTALAWKSIFDPIFGGLNPILVGLGVIERPLGWLSDPHLAMSSVIAVNVWKGIPFYVLLLLAGLKAIDRELLEAAEVDGANVVQRFRHVTLPGLRYVIVVVLLLSFISTFNQFGLIFLMTGGGPSGATKLYSILAYEKAIGSLQYGPGVAIAFSVAPLMAVLIWLLAKFMRHDEGRATATRKPNIGDHLLKLGARILNLVLDLVFLPVQLALQGLEALARLVRRQMGLPAEPARPQTCGTKARQPRHEAADPRSLHDLRALSLLLGDRHLAQEHAPDQQRTSIFWPDPFTLDQYAALIWNTQFLLWLGNSVLVATVSTVISVGFAALAAYALSRLKFAGAGLLTTFLLITYLLPGTLLFIPLYQILASIGLINSYTALMLTYPTFLLPFATWVMLGYYHSIPVELEEAAMIDGATRLGAFWKITLPLALQHFWR